MFTNRHHLRPNEIPFDAVCRLARAKDVRGLYLLQDSNIPLNVHKGSVTPVEQLAAEGNDEAVNLLIQKFGVLESLAATGYAKTNNREAIKQINCEHITGYAIARNLAALREIVPPSMHSGKACYGFAIGRHADILQSLQLHDPSEGEVTNMVMSGYAIEGHQDLLRLWMPWVFDWTNHREACLNVMKNYAMGRHIALVEEMILSVNASATGTLSRKAGMLIRKAICGYLEGGHFDLANEMMSRTSNHVEMIIDILKLYKLGYLERGIDKNVLRIMAFTDLYSLRKVIANHYIVNTIRPEYLAKSSRLNRIMHEYKVGYEAAQNLLVPKSYFWLLKGLELVGEGVITAFVFNKITSYLLGCADYEVCRIAETANEHTYIGASRFLLTKYQGGLFSHMQLFDGHKKLDDNYRRQNKVINRLDFSKANSRSSAFS